MCCARHPLWKWSYVYFYTLPADGWIIRIELPHHNPVDVKPSVLLQQKPKWWVIFFPIWWQANNVSQFREVIFCKTISALHCPDELLQHGRKGQ